MTRTVLFNCPIKAEIRAVDSQSDLRILLFIVMIRSIIRSRQDEARLVSR